MHRIRLKRIIFKLKFMKKCHHDAKPFELTNLKAFNSHGYTSLIRFQLVLYIDVVAEKLSVLRLGV